MSDLRRGTEIILLGLGAACGYGILHDLVTTRVCLEYFTEWHPPIFGGTHDPTLLAFSWGIIATWWVGLPLGCLLALAARQGNWPKLTARDILPSLLRLLGVMALCALCAGLFGYHYYRYADEIVPMMAYANAPLTADYFAHNASYMVGMLGGLTLCGLLLLRRRKLRNQIGAGR